VSAPANASGLRMADAEAVGGIPLVAAWSPEFMRNLPLVWGPRQGIYMARGVAPAYQHIRSQPAAAGRFIDEEDVRLRRRVVFLGSEVALRTFGNVQPVGQSIRLQGMPFEVIGVQRDKVQLSNYSRPDKESVFIPYTTAGQLWNTEFLDVLVYQAADPALDVRVSAQVKDPIDALRYE
jgi:putative ABC transport system permease protein